MVKARTGRESPICLEISSDVLIGLAVVMIAPSDITERETIGKRIEFGESIMTTFPLRTPNA